MPKIPIISDPGIEPSSALRAPRLSLDVPSSATGAKTAQALSRFGGDLAEAMRRVDEKRDRVAVEKTYGVLYDDLREVTYGEGGFFTKRGDQVEIGAKKILEKDLKKLKQKYAAELQGNRQQEAYSRKVDALVSRTLDSAARYESAQLQVASAQTNEAAAQRIAEEARSDIGAPADMDLLKSGADFIEAEMRDRGDTDADAIKLARKVFVSGILKSRIEALAEKSPALAKERFASHNAQNRFTTDDRDALVPKLESETLKIQAQAKTDELWAQYEDDEKKGMAAARALEGDLEDDVVRRMHARYTEKTQIEKQNYTDFVSGIVREIDSAPSFEAGHDIVDGYRDRLEGTELKQARAYVANRFGAKVKVTNQGARVEAMVRIDKGEIAGAEQLQLEYGDRLTPGDLEEVVKYQLNGGNVGGLKNSEATSWFKKYTSRTPEDRPEAYSAFWDFLKSKLEPGKKPTANDIKTWAVEFLTTPGVVQNSLLFFDRAKTRGEAIRAGDLEDFQPYTNEERDAAVVLMNKHNKQYPDKPVDINNPLHVEKFVILGVRK